MSSDIAVEVLKKKISQLRTEAAESRSAIQECEDRLKELRDGLTLEQQQIADCQAAITALERKPWPKT